MCVEDWGGVPELSPQIGGQDPETEQMVPVPLYSKGPKAYEY